MCLKQINYDKHVTKHCARYYGWLPASIVFKRNKIRKKIKYFTLCALQAIDIFMFEKNGILNRNKMGRLQDVYICEGEEKIVDDIEKLVRPPLENPILVGLLEDILTYDGPKISDGVDGIPDEDDPDPAKRYSRRTAVQNERIKSYFPFDIINFDPCNPLIEKNFHENKLYLAFEKIFELQKDIDEFLIFVTTNISKICEQVLNKFKKDFEKNISKTKVFKDSLIEKEGTSVYNEIDWNKRIALCFAKSIIFPVAKKNGWLCEHIGIFIYDYKEGSEVMMMSVVARIFKNGIKSKEKYYISDILNVIREMPNYYSIENANSNRDVNYDLREIIDYRERVRSRYKEN